MLKTHSLIEWKKYYLPVVLGKVHPGLHPGNVLITKGKVIKVLIHDFGRCYDITNESYKSTLLSFCFEFISFSRSQDD